MLFQRTQLLFPTSTSDGSQLYVNSRQKLHEVTMPVISILRWLRIFSFFETRCHCIALASLKLTKLTRVPLIELPEIRKQGNFEFKCTLESYIAKHCLKENQNSKIKGLQRFPSHGKVPCYRLFEQLLVRMWLSLQYTSLIHLAGRQTCPSHPIFNSKQ